MKIRLFGVAAILAGALGCSGDSETPVDANVDDTAIDAPQDAQLPTCACCNRISFNAASALDVASDGTTLYVLFRSVASGPLQLGTVGNAGGPPTVIATADDIVLASFDNVVFYALRTGTGYEVHQRTGTVDDVLGSVTLAGGATIKIAGNGTDVYVLHMESADTSLHRFSRTSPGGSPTLVASVPGGPAGIALGSTVAEIRTTSGNWLVSIPGPSTPSALSTDPQGLVFSGDQGFALRGQMQTSHASQWRIERIVPTQATIVMSSILINGGYDELRADATHLYYRVTSGSEAPGSMTYRALSRVAPDGTGVMEVCGSWPSNVLRLDATRLLGLELVYDGMWFVDVLAKP